MKDYKGIRVEYHILQSFPVTCLNRDDVGSPKTAIVGGVTRGRVSSQCWKRQVRLALHDSGIRIAKRTKKIGELIKNECTTEDANRIAQIGKIAAFLTKDTLFFISPPEVEALAQYVDNANFPPSDGDSASSEKKGRKAKAESGKSTIEKDVPGIMKKAQKKGFASLDGLDIALFGRMVANAVDLNVEAACSFSHAITTHKITTENDFFTAVDDFTSGVEDAGAGHLGQVEYTSGTYYRYISLDLGLLAETLGDDADIETAVQAFTKALYVAVPSAHQTTLAGYCPWNYAHVYVRKGQGMQLTFDEPVKAKGEGYLKPSIEAMKKQLTENETLAGTLFDKIGDFIYGEDKTYSIDNLCVDINTALEALPEKQEA